MYYNQEDIDRARADAGKVNSGSSSSANSKGWSAEEITNLVGTAAGGAADIIGSFAWLKKDNNNNNSYYPYYWGSTDSGSNNLVWIIAGLAVVAVLAFVLLKK